jgi:hypothetical protein
MGFAWRVLAVDCRVWGRLRRSLGHLPALGSAQKTLNDSNIGKAQWFRPQTSLTIHG